MFSPDLLLLGDETRISQFRCDLLNCKRIGKPGGWVD